MFSVGAVINRPHIFGRKVIMNNNPIGIFDSGVGGLTVVAEVQKALPNEEIVYFGDTARVPYGPKSKQTITKYSKQIINFLLSKNVKSIIIACGTVSSNSYGELTNSFDIPIIEMVNHGVNACLAVTKNKCVGVIGTEGTVRSNAYNILLKKKCPEIKVYSKTCPLFVPLAEEGWTDNAVAQLTTEIYLRELIDKKIDSLVLACTHYPLLLNSIKKATGDIEIINPAVEAARQVRLFLEENNLKRDDSEPSPEHSFYISDNTEKFDRICRLVLGDAHHAQLVDIEKY